MNKMNSIFKKIYGLDCLSIFLLLLSCIIDVPVFLAPEGEWSWLAIVAIIPLVICILRTFSGNHAKRWEENHIFLSLIPDTSKDPDKETEKANRKAFRYYDCPACLTEIRVPKGKGRIEITCPKCSMKFIKKT